MSNEGGVMRMRRVDSLDLPAGKTVVLEPGGYHVMLLDIVRPLKAGERVAVTLVIEEGGKRFELPVEAQVRSPAGRGPARASPVTLWAALPPGAQDRLFTPQAVEDLPPAAHDRCRVGVAELARNRRAAPRPPSGSPGAA